MSGLQLITFCILSVITLVHAQDSPQDFLNAHNSARAQVGVGAMTWDDQVAAFAQNYADTMAGSCNLVHSGGPYGENLAGSSGDMSATAAVNMWIEESQFYNYGTNSCNGGECLHYTQVVWRNSVSLGCAKTTCGNGGTFIICNYNPPGNYIDERPY